LIGAGTKNNEAIIPFSAFPKVNHRNIKEIVDQ
jgi:hypothetical protein